MTLQSPALESYLRKRAPECFPERPNVQALVELADDVWRVDLEGGRSVVAKHQVFGELASGRDDDLLAVEREVLRILAVAGCPVPRELAIDPETQFIFCETRGEQTLDDVCQEADSVRRQLLSQQVVRGFCRIEAALEENRGKLLPRVSPAATLDRLPETIRRIETQAREGLSSLLRRCGAGWASEDDLCVRLSELCAWLGARAASLGSTDYNARNIVVDSVSDEVSFIEFAKIGWDWPERRLVQYATSLGARHSAGAFVGLLDPQAVQLYASFGADRENRARALDGHHVLFHLNAAAMLCAALEKPQAPRHDALLAAWRRPQQRLMQLIEALAAPLSPDAACSAIRASFSRAVHTPPP